MKNLTLILILFSLVVVGQKPWNDDREPITKIDTQQVNIKGVEYRKLVTVTYEEISENQLRERYRYKKEQLEQLKVLRQQQIDQQNEEIEKLRSELQSEKEFYKKVAERKKWKTEIEVPPVKRSDPDAELERMKKTFITNPRKGP